MGVVGHVEWLTHALGVMPGPGEITALADPFEEPAGGGAVAASQVAKLGCECVFFTALGVDEAGRRSRETLEDLGVRVLAGSRSRPQTRALSATGATGDRGIAVIGRPTAPRADDPLPWEELSACAGAYFTGRDPLTLAHARRARTLVVTARRLEVLLSSGVRADVVVGSASDPSEAIAPEDLAAAPGVIVWTEGARGGRFRRADGSEGRWAAAPPPGPPVDSYGCGDSFAAGLTVGLARGLPLEAALELGARCGATCLTGRGGLVPQLRESAPG
ncbi:MAG: ribokinase [Miltoncostaeaceae bacterium]|nr:ribokinase [Miltoncostaeaceae bacterium]